MKWPKSSPQGEGRRREYPGATARLQHGLKPHRDIKRHETQREAPLSRLNRARAFELIHGADPLETRGEIADPLADLGEWILFVEYCEPRLQAQQRLKQLLDPQC